MTEMKRIIYWFGNILPILVSVVIYAFITQNDLHLWVGYNAAIVPIFLLAFNFALDYKAFSVKKLLVILLVEVVCLLIHMTYFQFSFSPISSVIWSLMFGTTVAITAIGGIVLYIISRKQRSIIVSDD